MRTTNFKTVYSKNEHGATTVEWTPKSSETPKYIKALDKATDLPALRNYVLSALALYGVTQGTQLAPASEPIQNAYSTLTSLVESMRPKENEAPISKEIITNKKGKKAPSTEELDSIISNMGYDAKNNIRHWMPIIEEISRKYKIQQGLLGGLLMQESYGNPIMLNSRDDGGAGMAMFQPGTARWRGLEVYGDSHETGADPTHGKKLRELVEEHNKKYSVLRTLDERFDAETAIEASAKFLVYLRDRYGSWNKAIHAYNAGNVSRYTMRTTHIDGTRRNQLEYLDNLCEEGIPVDPELYQELHAFK